MVEGALWVAIVRPLLGYHESERGGQCHQEMTMPPYGSPQLAHGLERHIRKEGVAPRHDSFASNGGTCSKR